MDHLRQFRLQTDGIRRCQSDWSESINSACSYGANYAAVATQSLQCLRREAGTRRLAIGSGKTNHAE